MDDRNSGTAADAARAVAGTASDAASASAGSLRISSARLLAGRNEVLIEHRGTLYRLKQTSLGKLILTK